MDTLQDILIKHIKQYPLMQITDIFKLIFQNEFAGGHLISNEKHSLQMLEEEICTNDKMRFEDIGNNLCRLYLSEENNITLNTINKFFVNTSNTRVGRLDNLKLKLESLLDLCEKQLLPFSKKDMEHELLIYKNNNYPIISHSPRYKQAYNPHYRVVDKQYENFIDIFIAVDKLLKTKNNIIIAIDGSSASGKTTLANLIKDVYDCNIFHMDDFFLTPELKTTDRLSEIGGNVDYLRFKKQIIDNLKNNNTHFQYDKYNCQTGTFSKSNTISKKSLNIVEGVYSLHPIYRDYYDFKIYLDIDKNVQASRILERNGSFMANRFQNEWIPLEDKYFVGTSISNICDLAINTTFNIHTPLGN